MSNVQKLISSASGSLCANELIIPKLFDSLAGSLAGELSALLNQRNGFYALESALHIFPSRSNQQELGLDVWNKGGLWRADYNGMADGCLFFAEDIFGGQFCIKEGGIYSFDPETGALEYIASDLEGWAEAIVTDYDVLTGYPLAHDWQSKNGAIPSGRRLLPKVPFVVGGEYSLDNLYLGESVEGMKLRASIANQIKNLPDGAQIKLDVVPDWGCN